MTPEPNGEPPWLALRERLAAEAAALDARGEAQAAAALRAVVQAWWTAQEQWNARLAEVLGVNHEINNALVGVRGNTQLLLMNPGAQQPGFRERLEVVIRESGRIQEAAGRLRELKASLGVSAAGRRAA